MSKHTDYKILIAEDEESLAMLIDYNLIKNGYKTKIVKDGDFVLSECEIFFPDLILLDWMLPNISGIELCRRLRTQKKYNNVRCILSENNIGMGAGNNYGLSEIDTDYGFILNPDVVLRNDTIDEIILASNKINEFSVISPIMEEENYPNY